MKTRIKNLLPLLLLLGLPGVVQAQDAYSTNADGSIYTYSTNADGSANIVAYAGPPWVVTIPTNINGLTVTSVGEYAFAFDNSLTSVTIPRSVTRIGEAAFEDDNFLTSVTIANSVTSIGDGAFDICSRLTSINVDAANPAYSSLGGVLFDKAEATLLKFPGGLGGSYTITNSVTSIGDEAFYDSSLTSVTIPASVTSIGGGAFESTSLTNVTIPNSVTNIGGGAFEYCTSLTSVTLPNSVTSIGDGAFSDCQSLTSVTLPNSVTSIGNLTFYDCISLTNVTMPNSVTSIGDYAFYDCTSLTSVILPISVTSIGYNAFEECRNMTSVIIPNSVTSIGEQAFRDCTSLTGVTIGNSVISIGEEAFRDCIILTNVTIPDSVTSIGADAFFDCARLTSVTIPNSVTSIGNETFEDCTRLTRVYFTGNSPSPTNDSTVFSGDPATVFYLPGTTGWGAMFDGLPTAPWFLPNPLILNHSASFGVQPGGFGFTISWATNASVVVEAATNLANPVWLPVSTSPLTSGTSYFSDPQWTNYPERFYRVTSAFTVGGTLTGLPAGDTVTLQDNGSDNLTLSNNGTFTFPTALPNGQSYSVTVSGTSGGTTIQTEIYPPVTANGSGTISGANVTNVAVQCTPQYTGNLDVDMYNAAVADGTANGGVPAVMVTEYGGPFRVTSIDGAPNSFNVGSIYAGQCRFITVPPGTPSCSSTILSGPAVQFGGALVCGQTFGYGY